MCALYRLWGLPWRHISARQAGVCWAQERGWLSSMHLPAPRESSIAWNNLGTGSALTRCLLPGALFRMQAPADIFTFWLKSQSLPRGHSRLLSFSLHGLQTTGQYFSFHIRTCCFTVQQDLISQTSALTLQKAGARSGPCDTVGPGHSNTAVVLVC